MSRYIWHPFCDFAATDSPM
uniref:Uncharacterized protein n=1 Tax=Rhizophora mucronata TaxID=61149 RepID=A0A2P2PEY3_RHIMU